MGKIDEVVSKIVSVRLEMFTEAQKRLDNLTKPQGSLGKLEDIAKRLVAIKENLNPSFGRKVIFVFAGDHGVAEEGVSAYPKEVTCQMVYNFLKGGAAINVLTEHVGAEVVIVDMGVAEDIEPHPLLKMKKVGYGTKNMLKEKAMTKEEAIQCVEVGIEVFEEEYKKNPVDMVGVGDMGIANTTSSSAILAAISGEKVEDVTGRGTGVDDKIWQRKVDVVRKALQFHLPHVRGPLDVLSRVGGYEIGGIAGCIIAAASYKVPVVLDGFICTAGALIATELCPKLRDYLFASHLSGEKGHRIALEHLKLVPLLDLDLRLGEGTGAALAMSLIEASAKIISQMATFEEAKVAREINNKLNKCK
ncbi:nicotinate-nucleotide--dimethylbenzimidazole phosphoribosyltransferase [Candidatus Aerophobetes bacterium]|nr:nicotinate-nucleotide--dimethylbenzimidazole phosphoribosyltransferase [Candidatus Aerophobetes bacterium]